MYAIRSYYGAVARIHRRVEDLQVLERPASAVVAPRVVDGPEVLLGKEELEALERGRRGPGPRADAPDPGQPGRAAQALPRGAVLHAGPSYNFV